MRALLVTTAMTSGMLLAATSYATPFSIDFGAGPLGDLGPTHSWTNDGVTVTATAFGPGTPDLFAENIKPEDIGLGETNRPDHEIASGSWDQFTFSPALTNLSFFASSTNPADTWAFYGSNTPGSLGAFLVSGNNDNPVDLSSFLGKYAELDLTALPQDQQPHGSNDTILAGGFSGTIPTPAPEPGTIAILCAALVGLFGWLRTRRLVSARPRALMAK